MKLFLLPVIILSFSSHNFFSPGNFQKSFIAKDTSFKHITDGKPGEWSSKKFETDLATEIKYAVDNDTQNLYLALIIPNSGMQMKMMRNGMKLYIDPRGKKKEGKGIEFPVKRDPAADNSVINFKTQSNDENTELETPEQRKAKMKSVRAAMTLNLTSMKVFGFAGDEAEEQGLIMPGSANVAFAWDSTDAMCIEYKIPIALLGVSLSSAQKDISIGWKLNGFQRPTKNSSSESSGENRHGSRNGGGHKNFGNGGGNGNQGSRSQQNFEAMKDQSFWTKYVFK